MNCQHSIVLPTHLFQDHSAALHCPAYTSHSRPQCRFVLNLTAILQICTVFAQLTVDGKWQGPHVFVVRLRDNNSQLTPGVKILDNGPKMGLNGVDNGQIWFDHVKVPRDALLDRYASVTAEGVYTSSIKSVGQRFGMTVGGLTTGTQTDRGSAYCMTADRLTACDNWLLARQQSLLHACPVVHVDVADMTAEWLLPCGSSGFSYKPVRLTEQTILQRCRIQDLSPCLHPGSTHCTKPPRKPQSSVGLQGGS